VRRGETGLTTSVIFFFINIESIWIKRQTAEVCGYKDK